MHKKCTEITQIDNENKSRPLIIRDDLPKCNDAKLWSGYGMGQHTTLARKFRDFNENFHETLATLVRREIDHPNKIFEHFSLFPLLKSLPRWDVNHMECHLVAMKICHLNKKSRKELKRSQVLWQGLNELQRSSALVSRIYKRKSSHISSTQKCRSIP